MTVTARWLVDKSALRIDSRQSALRIDSRQSALRIDVAAVEQALAPRVARGLVGICIVTEPELATRRARSAITALSGRS